MIVTDFKRGKRHRASKAEWEELHLHFTDQLCWCCGQAWDELHHVLPRGQGGCDRIENLAPLCRNCHRLVEARDPWARAQLFHALEPENFRYLWTRIGVGWHGWVEKNFGLRSTL